MTYVSQTPTEQPARPTRRKALFIAISAAVVLLGALVGGILYFAGDKPTLDAAEKACNDGRPGTELMDGGKTLIVDMAGRVDIALGKGGVNSADIACILDRLDAPAAVTSKMEATTALAGSQEDSWGDFTATWTYHPDSGLDLTIEQR